MIHSFRHKGLSELFDKGRSSKIRPDLHKQCLTRLDALNHAEKLEDLNITGFNFHGLEGSPKRYSISLNEQIKTAEAENNQALLIKLLRKKQELAVSNEKQKMKISSEMS